MRDRRLLAPMSDAELAELTSRSRAVTRQRFGRTIQLFAPLYLSNECIDTCRYCGFSRENQIARKTLSVTEVEREAELLIERGFRHLLLVSGEHPVHVSPAYVAEISRRLRGRLASLSIETAPFHEEDYQLLRESGVDGVVVYQETYDRHRYREVHLAGPKKSFERRLAVPEKAARAGIRRIGMGVLLGLADWRQEAPLLVRHVTELRRRYWQTEWTISLPRLRPCASDFSPPAPVTDRDLIQMVAALRITLPEIPIYLSTREGPALRDRLMEGGITHMSAGSRTNPGGYTTGETTEQFEIEDHRSPDEVAAAIAARGLEPVWKDWDQTLV